MDVFKEFLETSTIHGLGYIVSTKKLSRFFWVCVVIAGFILKKSKNMMAFSIIGMLS